MSKIDQENPLNLSGKQWASLALFMVVYGGVIFLGTRAYYISDEPPAAVATVPPTSDLAQTMSRFNLATGNLLNQISKSGTELTRLADNYFQQKNYTKAAELYERLLKLEPNNVEARNDLGLSLFYIGRRDEAVAHLRMGVASDSKYQRIHLTLGFVLANSGQPDAALEALQDTIALDSESGIGKEAGRMRDRIIEARK